MKLLLRNSACKMVDAASQSTTRPTEAVKTNPSHFDPILTTILTSQNEPVPF